MKENQILYRYEFKYILNKKISDQIEKEARNFMIYDGHVKKELNNKYFVRSLYFENNFSSNFYEKVDGMKIRRKYRLRTYSNFFDPKVPIFFEVKGRISERTYKKRINIKNKYLNLFLSQSQNFNLLNLYPNNEMITISIVLTGFCQTLVKILGPLQDLFKETNWPHDSWFHLCVLHSKRFSFKY